MMPNRAPGDAWSPDVAQVFAAISQHSGPAFFEVLAARLAELVDADFIFIGRLDTQDETLVRTLAWGGRDWEPGEVVDVAKSPCRAVLGAGECIVPSGVQAAFPEFEALVELNVEGYVGVGIAEPDGRILGIIAALYKQEPAHPAGIAETLSLFNVRAASEADRLNKDDHLGVYRRAFASITDLVAFVDGDYRYRLVNESYAQAFGSTVAALTDTLVADNHGERFEETIRPVLDRAFAGEVAKQEVSLPRPEGGELVVESLVTPFQFVRQRPGAIVIARDVTERQKQSTVAERMLRGQKTDALALLTGGIAHEFNNVLAILLGFGRMGANHPMVAENEDLSRYLGEIVRAGERAEVVVSELLKFSRPSVGDRQRTNLSELIEQAIQLLRPAFPSSIQFRPIIDAGVPSVTVERNSLQQVLVNLLVNGRDGMDGRGVLTVELRKPSHQDGYCDSCHQRFSGDHIRLVVRDTGEGASPDVIGQAFDPFFSTKPIGSGRGLGLSAVHGIVHEHGGHVQISSGPAIGFSVAILLPVT
ncbi:MAG: ATP-binding protein [Pseudomonadota bacterium]